MSERNLAEVDAVEYADHVLNCIVVALSKGLPIIFPYPPGETGRCRVVDDWQEADDTFYVLYTIATMAETARKRLADMRSFSGCNAIHPTFCGVPIEEAAQIVLSARHQKRGSNPEASG